MIINKDKRARNWSFILYPESAPVDWKEILDGYHVKTVVSPLHDLDISKSGELKKPHYHVLLMFDGKKSYTQVYDMYTEKLNCTIPQKVESVRGLVRYFCHLDNPEKAQYKDSDIICFAGVDLKTFLKSSEEDRDKLIMDIGSFITKNNIYEFCDLWEYALDNQLEDWIPLLASNAYCFNMLIRSKKFANES